MTRPERFLVPCALALTVVLSAPGQVRAQGDSLDAVKAAYLSTEYEEALTLLASTPDAAPVELAETYRALCLMALGRVNEVNLTLRALVARNPAYVMSEAEVPPRLIALFAEARRRHAQALATEAYANAKVSFDAGRYVEASARFSGVLSLLSTYAAVLDSSDAATRDLPQLSRGFRDLADAEVAHANAVTAAMSAAPARSADAAVVPRAEVMIESVVQRYALAYSALDAGAVVRVFPSENLTLLKAAFNRLKAQTVETRGVTVAVDPAGDMATVSLVWAAQAAPRVGNAIKVERPATLRMARSGDGSWLIVARQ